MEQDRIKVTIDHWYEVTYVLSIVTEISDLGWPWKAITHFVSKYVRLSEPNMKIRMKIDACYYQQKFGPVTRYIFGNLGNKADVII